MDALILNKKERDTLLSEIDSKDMYKAVLAFIDTVKQKDNCPFSVEEYRQLAKQAVKDRRAGVNYTGMEDMRKLYPR
jgi:hypothetical protein